MVLNLGPVVRVGPNEVCFCDVSAFKQIYNIKEDFTKSSLCDLVVKAPAPSVFSTTEVEVHRRHRKLLAQGLSEKAVDQMCPSVDAKVKLAIQRMWEETERNGASDIYKWWTLLVADITGELTFGQSFGMLEAGKVGPKLARKSCISRSRLASHLTISRRKMSSPRV